MRILLVNWLDRANPQAGGAEVHLFEIFGRLAKRGHEVTLVTSGFPGASPRVEVDGIRVRRYGGRHTFALKGRGAVRLALDEAPWDVVVEDINKLPLFLPTLTGLPVYVIVPHLFGTTAFHEAALPVATLVWLAEKPIPIVYRGAQFHAISQSTRDDLVLRGVSSERVHVILPGVDSEWMTPDPGDPREDRPTFLYVGRIKRYKGLEVALHALARAMRDAPEVRLQIAGQGDDQPRLEEVAQRLGIAYAVQFLGFVPEVEKRRLLRRAWGLVFPSEKEGWGISNVEAAACGTPAVASDSPGLRESVRHGETGILVPHGDVGALADAIVRLARDPALVERLGTGARRFAETLSWDRAADETETHLFDTIRQARAGRKE